MALTKYRLGELIELREITNEDLSFGVDDVRGVNNLKKLMPTKADINGRDLAKFQVVHPGEFVFNHRTSRNGSKFSIAYNNEEKPVICTEDYVVFRIREDATRTIRAYWLYMFFNRSEFDRYVVSAHQRIDFAEGADFVPPRRGTCLRLEFYAASSCTSTRSNDATPSGASTK